ncbi:hypothetical protein MLD38_024953 [Melastoma candidum]|uniref:Uncharacterized protein n=1 Tax=Melastoma candidum TaxID=119954 RepID=A0ACB9NZ04_9MYRT|nr:hypothetical protein MLD38_024953 [Melastoma candidum]
MTWSKVEELHLLASSPKDGPVLGRIEDELMRRSDGHFTPGGLGAWDVLELEKTLVLFTRIYASYNQRRIRKRLEKLFANLLEPETFRSS